MPFELKRIFGDARLTAAVLSTVGVGAVASTNVNSRDSYFALDHRGRMKDRKPPKDESRPLPDGAKPAKSAPHL
jgi:hypothetical protein